MTPRLVSAQYTDGYRVRLRFQDGREAEIDLEGELWGPVFEPLRDVEQFRRFSLDPELDTIRWPTGADLAPEFLYAQVVAGCGDGSTD